MKHKHRIGLIVPFFLLLAAPVLNDCFHFVEFPRTAENRRFNDSLSIDIARLDDFPAGCEAYVNDNFAFRTPAISAYKLLKFRLYQVSPNPDQLIVGRNGRYFIAQAEKMIYEGEFNFPPGHLRSIEAEWLRRKQYFDSLGIVVYLMPAPTGLEIYPEDLPYNVRKRYPYNRFDQIEKQFRKRLPHLLVNPVDVLKKGKSQGNIYYRLDNHWTELGGYLAAKQLLERIKKEHFPELDIRFLDEYTWGRRYRNFGHFVNLIGVSGLGEWEPTRQYTERAEQVANFDLDFPQNGVHPDERQYHFVHTKPKNKLKLLVIRDSFGQALYPVLKEAFAESLFIFDEWHYGMNKSIVEQFRPDIVIYETYDPDLVKYAIP